MGAFENDILLKQEVERLVKKYKVTTIIETGTYLGDSAKAFAGMVQHVYTIEINKTYIQKARQTLAGLDNVSIYEGDSPVILERLLPKISTNMILIFLDAHWYNYNPLIDELKVIIKNGIKPILLIHDFKVPGRPDLGFDVYNGQAYEWDWVKEWIGKIYNGKFSRYYNNLAYDKLPPADNPTGLYRGCLFVEPD